MQPFFGMYYCNRNGKTLGLSKLRTQFNMKTVADHLSIISILTNVIDLISSSCFSRREIEYAMDSASTSDPSPRSTTSACHIRWIMIESILQIIETMEPKYSTLLILWLDMQSLLEALAFHRINLSLSASCFLRARRMNESW